ncbi:MAG: hypothetical protein ACTTJ6_06820 [Treponema sp.]
MLKKIIFGACFILCFTLMYSEDSLFDYDKKLLDSEKTEIIMKLYESEGLLNGWFKACVQDFVKFAKEYDNEKLRNEKIVTQLQDRMVKMVIFAVLCSFVIPSFDDYELSRYVEVSGLDKELSSLSKETTSYIDRFGDEIMKNIGIGGEKINAEILNQYIDITITSIKEYLDKKVKS